MNLSKIKKYSKGFTLIEILLVVAILSILLVVVFASLNPARRLADTRNARRWNDVNQLLTAIHECIIDNGTVACGIDTDENGTEALQQLGSCATGGATLCTGAADGCLDVATELSSYVSSIPVDPSVSAAGVTGYSLQMTNGIITIAACGPEDADGTGAPNISVSR